MKSKLRGEVVVLHPVPSLLFRTVFGIVNITASCIVLAGVRLGFVRCIGGVLIGTANRNVSPLWLRNVSCWYVGMGYETNQ